MKEGKITDNKGCLPESIYILFSPIISRQEPNPSASPAKKYKEISNVLRIPLTSKNEKKAFSAIRVRYGIYLDENEELEALFREYESMAKSGVSDSAIKRAREKLAMALAQAME